MTDTTSLDALLEPATVAKTEASPVEAQQPAPETPETVETVAPTGATETAAPPAAASEKSPGPTVPRAAFEDERRKRQELERKFQDLTSQFQSFQPQQRPQNDHQQPVQPQIPEKMPDPWTDPEGALVWQQQMFDRRLAAQQEEVFQTRVLMSREMVKSQPEFEEIETLFFEEAAKNPQLKAAVRSHPMPALYVYEQGKKLKAMREIGDDPVAYRARLEAEIAAKFQGQTPQPQAQAPRAQAPKSLAGAPSSQPRDPRGRFAGPASLDDILGG